LLSDLRKKSIMTKVRKKCKFVREQNRFQSNSLPIYVIAYFLCKSNKNLVFLFPSSPM